MVAQVAQDGFPKRWPAGFQPRLLPGHLQDRAVRQTDRQTGLGAHSGDTERGSGVPKHVEARIQAAVGYGEGLTLSTPWERWCSTVHLSSQITSHRCKGCVEQTRVEPLSEGFCQRNSTLPLHPPPPPSPIFTVAFNRASARPSCSQSTRPLSLTDHKCCSGSSGTARVPRACGRQPPAADGGAAPSPAICMFASPGLRTPPQTHGCDPRGVNMARASGPARAPRCQGSLG